MPLSEACALLAVELPRPATEAALSAWKDADLPRAYKAAVKAWHPDRGTTEQDRLDRTEKMKRINAAREQLAGVRVRTGTFDQAFRGGQRQNGGWGPTDPWQHFREQQRQRQQDEAEKAKGPPPPCERCGETAQFMFGQWIHICINRKAPDPKPAKPTRNSDVSTATRTDLDAIGNPIGCPREKGEKDVDYRERLRNHIHNRDDAAIDAASGVPLSDFGKRWGCPRHGFGEGDFAYRNRLKGWAKRPGGARPVVLDPLTCPTCGKTMTVVEGMGTFHHCG